MQQPGQAGEGKKRAMGKMGFSVKKLHKTPVDLQRFSKAMLPSATKTLQILQQLNLRYQIGAAVQSSWRVGLLLGRGAAPHSGDVDILQLQAIFR
jgi:hypothetical protein